MIKTAIVGFGNVGRCVHDALAAAKDMELVCIVESPNVPVAHGMAGCWVSQLKDIRIHGDVDVAILALPSRLCPDAAEELLAMGINSVDAFDVHEEIWTTKCRLDEVAKKHGAAGIIAAGWDPGSDSIVRALFEAMAPSGLSYTDFGPGMSMGHTVAVKAMGGVKNALSMTIPTGSGVHRRMVYVELQEGAALSDVTARIKNDSYFAHDETHVIAADDISSLTNMGHGVEITRNGVSAKAHNQVLAFSMKINNPALTGQIMVGAARAVVKCMPGCYTLLEIPVIDLLPGEQGELIKRLV